MTQRFAGLYPETITQASVVPTFAVPKFPPAEQIRNETSVRNFYADRLLGEYEIAGTADRIAVIDKLFPHARYDAMILASNNEMRSSASDLSSASLAVIFDLASRFVSHVSDPGVVARFGLEGGEIHICFNFDRDTIDRDNAMFYDKRFHLHLNCWTADDLAGIQTMPFGEVADPMMQRRLVDPVAALAATIICEAAGPDMHGFTLSADNQATDEPIGLKVKIGTWSRLNEPAFHKLLQSMHETAQRAYRDIRAAFTGTADSGPPWTRPRLHPVDRIEANLNEVSYLSTSSRQLLLQLATELSDVEQAEMERYRTDPALAVRKLTLNGLDYSVGLFTRQVISATRPLAAADDVTLLMQCRLLGDVGGAGLPPLRGNAAVRLDRKNGPVMTPSETAARTDFRRAFIEAHVNPLAQRGAITLVEQEKTQ